MPATITSLKYLDTLVFFEKYLPENLEIAKKICNFAYLFARAPMHHAHLHKI